jgi:hypothetical protein
MFTLISNVSSADLFGVSASPRLLFSDNMIIGVNRPFSQIANYGNGNAS